MKPHRIEIILGIILLCVMTIALIAEYAARERIHRKLEEIENNLEVINRALEGSAEPTPAGGSESTVTLPDATLVFPVAADDWYVSSPYGTRISPIYHIFMYHNGMDISVKNPRLGMPQIVAVAAGTIRDHWYTHPTRGRYIVINHGGGMVSSYSHLSESYIHERRADGTPWRVKAGEVIGRMGATGACNGAHLHFEIEIDGKIVNPALYLEQYLEEWEQ